MKKIMLSFLLIGAVVTIQAQETQEVVVYKLSRTNANSFPGDIVPGYIKANFEKTYPGQTVLSWDPVKAYWRASYNNDNRIIFVFYDEKGVNYRAALPVLQNNVTEEVVNTALTVYGPIVYGITRIKGAGDKEVYQVRLLDNGATKIVWMNSDGTAAADVFKIKTDELAGGTPGME